MLLPLLALRALFMPQHFWEALPMAARCAAGSQWSFLRARVRACVLSHVCFRMYACAGVCVRIQMHGSLFSGLYVCITYIRVYVLYTHTHTHMYMYVYTYVCACVCVCVCVCMYGWISLSLSLSLSLFLCRGSSNFVCASNLKVLWGCLYGTPAA